jgi:hypothetical protein
VAVSERYVPIAFVMFLWTGDSEREALRFIILQVIQARRSASDFENSVRMFFLLILYIKYLTQKEQLSFIA